MAQRKKERDVRLRKANQRMSRIIRDHHRALAALRSLWMAVDVWRKVGDEGTTQEALESAESVQEAMEAAEAVLKEEGMLSRAVPLEDA